jgi:plasmid stabilization system protein ParE
MENQKKQRKIIITENFEKQGEEYYDYLFNESPQNADKFADGIAPLISKVAKNPGFYSREPNLPTKNNWYRFVLHMKSWKIIFKVTNEFLIFLGIIHTSRHQNRIKDLRTNKYK